MLDRNRRIKRNPEKFQQNKDCFDIILSCEGMLYNILYSADSSASPSPEKSKNLERVYDQILENFNTREQEEFGQCHIINCDIVDNHEDATLGAIILSQLIEELVQHEGIVSHVVPACQNPIFIPPP